MKRKIFAFAAAVLSAVLCSCDMVYVQDAPAKGGREMTEEQRDEMERSERFLKIVNMPVNTQIQNVFSVEVANSEANIAGLDRSKSVSVYRDAAAGSSSVYLPLAYADNSEFTESGFFYSAFSIHVDALTKYVVEISDKLLVQYVDGRGSVDALSLPSSVSENGGKEITEEARDELERTGRFLKIAGMPVNTQIQNVFSVEVANSAANIAELAKNKSVSIYRDAAAGSSDVYLPLAYSDHSEFTESGFFYSAFSIHVDALTSYVVNISEKLLVQYVDGRGSVSVHSLPDRTPPPKNPSYLTIYNLPANFSAQNVAGVLVRNQAGIIASCPDYSLIEVSANDLRTAAKVPLVYHNLKTDFMETGAYYVSFDINVDVETRYLLTPDDRVKVNFNNGNGFLDIQNIPLSVIPYLTIQGLPFWTTARQISNVAVYNLAGQAASCSNYAEIDIFKDKENVTARIPLTASSGGFFLDTGRFAVTFTVNVDVETQIVIERADNIILDFSGGSALFDLFSTFGFFDAQLTGANKPAIKAGSSFDVNGHRHTVTRDLPVDGNVPSESCVLYLYAFRVDTDVFYEYSKTPPVYDSKRNGYYSGFKRALWKMIYLHGAGLFLFKTPAADSFPQLETSVISSADYDSLVSGRAAGYSLSGSGNPASSTVTLQPGVYAVKLSGAGGAGGCGYVQDSQVLGSSEGGSGGSIIELITLDRAVTFTAFTGSGGFAPPAPSPSGTFSISATINYIHINLYVGRQDYVYSDLVLPALSPLYKPLFETFPAASGGGGGGGGSGTFLYSSAEEYLLLAGGGGGGSGTSYLTPGGAGGAGGSVGPGGGGGAAGYLRQSFKSTVSMTASGGHGGTGGGLNGGSGGQCDGADSNRGGASAGSVLNSNASVPGGYGTPSHPASSFFPPPSSISFLHRHVQVSDTGAQYYRGDLTDLPAISFASMSYEISSGSGSGGSAAAASWPAGPLSWLNTNSANGAGASPPEFTNHNFFSGQFNPYDMIQYWQRVWPYSESSRPDNTDASPSYVPASLSYTSTLSFSLGGVFYGSYGQDGGNNRNSSRGGGAAGGTVSGSRPSNGSPGSITIHKIY